MKYYNLLLVLLLGVGFLYKAIKEKQLKDFTKAMAVLLGAVVVSVLANATLLLTTREYADWSTRSKSTLTITPDGTPKEQNSGLPKEYITVLTTKT